MSIKNDLMSIVGNDAVYDDQETLLAYSRDQSFVAPRMPDLVAFAHTVEQVQEVVRYANKTRVPLVPFSSGLNFQGAAVPREGGIVLNMSRMNKILAVDVENWSCVIEPGVTESCLQDELEQHGLRAMLPFGVHPNRSALTSFLERDPAIGAASFEYGNELIMDTEIVLPTGELFRTGLWASGVRPGSPMGPVRAMLNRLWTGAQGTLGIMTKMNIKVEYLPRQRKLFLIPFDSFPEAMEPLRMLQGKEIGLECFMLNAFNVAALLCADWAVPEHFPAPIMPSREFESLRLSLPAWLLAVCISSGPRMPEGKIAYETEAFESVCAAARLPLYEDGRLRDCLLSELLRPWGILKKFCYRGSVHNLAFKTTLRRFPDFQKTVMELINTYNYPLQDVGVYVLPLERGRAYHCEADFHCNPQDSRETERVRALWRDVSERMIDEGAFFDRPYGVWADMVFRRAGSYTKKLQELKHELDPCNIMNPGQLCF